MTNNRELPVSTSDLKLLVRYLIEKGLLDEGYSKLRVLYDLQQDEVNNADPRSFAYVLPGCWAIYSTCEIEKLQPKNRVGILLHELSHLRGETLHSEEEEVDTDVWILEQVPEADYRYEDASYWRRRVRNLQTVSRAFLRALKEF